ncbi:uncharacterized protein LAESUDRAFT_697227 [Laetiporus sulphureus 93-53]|uniref:K Homology domain-containing protein n=1 Tax=Laetiporus sulphureus 93-53 TaxID=1314785 RepID=A0A165F4A7_9APHY|nr:uncharacterized protein LAESUDRAFT_697227 [Laetiporus sulphureus 93-53]KZT08355.1 hypothetical protein LAESUDRAFT_697227 [Laetiporus sulphureus 93-53]
MASNAAELKKKHDGIEAQDSPLASPASPPVPTNGEPDIESQFPSLVPSAAASSNKTTGPAWGSSAPPAIRPSVPKQHIYSDTFNLSQADIAAAGKDGKPVSTGEVMKRIMSQCPKVKLEASTNNRLHQTTFYLKSDLQKELEKAKRMLLAYLSPVVTSVLHAPASTIPIIIGPKGANLHKVREQTGVKVDIPRRDSIPALNGNGATHGAATSLDDGEEEEEATVPVTITGPQPLVQEAADMINVIIAAKRSRTTQRVRDIAPHILPFLTPRRAQFETAADGGEISLSLNQPAREITVSGEREAVGHVIDSIRSAINYFTAEITQLKIVLPKRQHRLLTGKDAGEIMTKSKCVVIVPKPEETSEEIVVWGKPTDIGLGVQTVMEKANSAYIHEFPLPGPISVSRQLLTYIIRVGYAKALSMNNPGASVYTPALSSIEKASALNVDIVGEKPAVDAAVSQLSALIGKLIGATKELQIDWLVHPFINSHKNAKKIKAYHDAQNVLVFFPPEDEEQSSVLLVYDPTSPSASPSPVEKAKNLDEVEKELLKMARDAADVKTQVVTVEKKWHDAVTGRGGTTLNAIIGEDKTLSIKVGAEAGDPSTEDVILVRGISADVDRVVKEILEIVENAKNDEIVNSYAVEFDIDKVYVGRVVGAQGASVNRLRDTLGVKIDFVDETEREEQFVGKKKKAAHQKSHVKIIGRKENVEEAKKRILTQVERLADETFEKLNIDHKYHSSLIGHGGKYVVRLEEKYGVKITFPRDSGENGEGRTREQLGLNEVLLKGGRKGVSGAKAELLDAVEFEKESNVEEHFTVPTRAVARILGKAGATINEIKDKTGAQIDVDKANDLVTNVTIRGTKDSIAEAKAEILVISDRVGEEATETVEVESQFHRTIIGAGGQGLRDLIIRCGGPSDSKTQAGLVRFPRQGESSTEVRIRGEPKLVAKIKSELEKTVATIRDRVTLAAEVPASQHRALIGRGGQHLNDIQNRLGVQIQFPGSRSYHQVGEPENMSDMDAVDPADIVKISGSRTACEKAVEELKTQVKPAAPESVTATVIVPLKYHHAVTQQGNFFRTLRSFGVHAEQSALPQRPAVPPYPVSQAGVSEARIDDPDAGAAAPEVQWQVVPNYQDAEEGESEWTFKAWDQASLDRALKLTQDAIEHAEKMSHVGFLTLPDRLSFPRIVGTKGANIGRLRNESGADITVSREDSTIVIIGSESAIEIAKEAILKIAANNTRSRGRRDA